MAHGGSEASITVERAALAMISLAAAAIHFAVMSDHFSEYFAFGVVFAVVAFVVRRDLWGFQHLHPQDAGRPDLDQPAYPALGRKLEGVRRLLRRWFATDARHRHRRPGDLRSCFAG